MHKAILGDPCLKRYDHQKFLVLCTDFSADCFSYVALQPGNDEAPLSAMHTCMRCGDFLFMTKDFTAVHHPVAFGCRRTRGTEKRLHSHLGKCFLGNWAINKCRQMCFGQRFTWMTNCQDIKFILSYNGRKIQPSPVFRCVSCVGIWTLSIVTTSTLPTLIIPLALALTCAMTRSVITFSALQRSNDNTLHHLRCPLSRKICLIIGDYMFPNNFLKPYLPLQSLTA